MNTTSPSDPRSRTRARVGRHFFSAMAAAAGGAAPLPLLDAGPASHAHLVLAIGCALLAVLCLAARRLNGRHLNLSAGGAMLGALGLIVLSSIWLQSGVGNLALGFCGLLVCLACLVGNLRVGALVAGASAAAVLGLGWAEQQGWIAGAAAAAQVSLPRRMLLLLLLVGSGLGSGVLLARHYRAAKAGREQRFTGLLGIAADCYWESDTRHCITHVSRRAADGRFVLQAPSLRRPWQDPDVAYDRDALQAHRADLKARRPFRDLYVRVRQPDGSVQHEMVSGEPRFDAAGTFVGYWGVTRDVSTDMRARAALAATETRYRELFTRIPTALVLHRRGRVLDANAAAAALFGYPDAAGLHGQDITAACETEAERQRLREQIAQLDSGLAGHSLPEREGQLVTPTGQRVGVRVSSVRVDTEDGPAVLSIYLDDTERRAAEDAVRRSEALLSHLVATSPDVITLSELDSGRYAMVNHTFTRLSGYTADEVIGRSAEELGVWDRRQDRDKLLQALRQNGSVTDMPTEFVTKSGRRLAMLVSAARFAMDQRDYLVINARDVTVAESARLEREAILENASIGIALTRGSSIHLANPRLEQMFGWPPGTLSGQHARVVWPDAATYRRISDELVPVIERGEQVEADFTMRRCDGSLFLCRLLARAVDPSHPSRGGTIWIAEDVTERRSVEQALAKARDDAEAASQAKSAFLANTSHEIRTPLNGLVGLARLARQPDVDDARRRQYLEQISDSAETLSAIISDILDLSKIEAGKLHLETVSFDLQALLRTLQRAYGTLAEARGLRLQLSLDNGVPTRVLGDPVRLRQILSNFLTNALKFTQRGGVHLRAAFDEQPGRLRFEVVDTGPGIDAATQERLFQPFTQADQSTTRRFGGTGLGLSICRELAELMAGAVGVNSVPGRGSCFWAALPLPPAPQDEVPSAFGALDGAASPLAGARVLLVEDNPVNMLIGAALLEQWGVKVEQAGDGRQAIAAVDRAVGEGRPFHAVLMDVQMPLMSGHEAARLLRRRFDARSLPIVALTAAALVSERDQALASGMNDFLTKPIDAQRLHDTLAVQLRASRQ